MAKKWQNGGVLCEHTDEFVMSYQAYLRTKHWAAVKSRFLASLPAYRCNRCGSREFLAVHHNTYRRIGHEDLGDLELLCRGCHASHHRREDDRRERKRRKRQRIREEDKTRPPIDQQDRGAIPRKPASMPKSEWKKIRRQVRNDWWQRQRKWEAERVAFNADYRERVGRDA